jgi:HMG box factor
LTYISNTEQQKHAKHYYNRALGLHKCTTFGGSTSCPGEKNRLNPQANPSTASGSTAEYDVIPIQPTELSTTSRQSTVSAPEDLSVTQELLRRIRFLAKVSHRFISSAIQKRGTVIAVEGQDTPSVKLIVNYLMQSLQGKYQPCIFNGPDYTWTNQAQVSIKEAIGPIGEYLNVIKGWSVISDQVANFVQSYPGKSFEIQRADRGTVSLLDADSFRPIAIVPQYKLTTVNAFVEYLLPNELFTPEGYWKWAASLWDNYMQPDVLIYVQNCKKQDAEQFGYLELHKEYSQTILIYRVVDTSNGLDPKMLESLQSILEKSYFV